MVLHTHLMYLLHKISGAYPNHGGNTSKRFHRFGQKIAKIPKIQESQEIQVSCDSMKEPQAQMEGIGWFSSFSRSFKVNLQ